MRIYARDRACGFRFVRAQWGAFSNFQPLAVPIAAGPWMFRSRPKALYQAAKVRRTPRRSAAHRRSADAGAGRRHRPHHGSGHRPRLERPARRRHALGAAPEARGQPGRDRHAPLRNRRPPHRRGLHPRPLVGRPSRRRPLRGPERPRTPLDGAPRAAPRRRPRGLLRRLARPHPRRPAGLPPLHHPRERRISLPTECKLTWATRDGNNDTAFRPCQEDC